MANEKWVADARQLLIEIERIYEDHYSRSYDQTVHDIFNAIRRIVRRNAAFGFVEVVHGRWEKRLGIDHCSVCHKVRPYDVQADVVQYWQCDYCPNCGASMMDGDGNGTA